MWSARPKKPDVRLKLGEVEVVMFRLAQLKTPIASGRPGLNELFGFKHVAAIVALVGSGARKSADVAGTLNIPVWQELRASW
jgi:hypothetical protein